jgi:hypothetical protein
MIRSVAARAIFATLALAACAAPARAFHDVLSLGSFSLDVTGYLEGRLVVSGATRSWEEGGLGKIRYGSGDGDIHPLARVEGAVVLEPKFGFDWSGYVALIANSQQRTAVDITEAYLQYKPAPNAAFGFRAKAGAFYPPISRENGAIAWTSPYTLTSSAINGWVGEELKTIGGEFTVFHRGSDVEVALSGAAFMANDPAGTLLAWRGWSLNDRETGFFDRLQLAQVRIIRPTGGLFRQAPTEKPFHEIDGRAGYYANLAIDAGDYGKLTALVYDNNADDRDIEKGQWAWLTQFWALGYKAALPAEIDFIAQYMDGRTTVITIPAPVGPIVSTDYWSAFGMVSKEWDRHRISFRAEYFKTIDRDTFPDNNNERGTAFTLAYIFRPAVNQRLTLEFLRVNSRRPERVFMGLAESAHENQTQLSYRFFF